MTLSLAIGYTAAFLGTICWIPQAVLVWKTKDTKSLSLVTNLMFLATFSLTITVGIVLLVVHVDFQHIIFLKKIH